MFRKLSPYLLLVIVPAMLVTWYFVSAARAKPVRMLPYFEPKNRAEHSTPHKVQDFSFVNQFNDTITQTDLAGKIYVTEFFFTTCQSICPIMNRNLQEVYRKYREENSLRLLSHTVDPETDSVPVLRGYAASHGVNDQRWYFVTGKKRDLYHMARQAYLLDDGAAHGSDDFVHTQKFALVDKEKRIRGFYDGTDSLEIRRLIQDIDVLLQEYRHNEKSAS